MKQLLSEKLEKFLAENRQAHYDIDRKSVV